MVHQADYTKTHPWTVKNGTKVWGHCERGTTNRKETEEWTLSTPNPSIACLPAGVGVGTSCGRLWRVWGGDNACWWCVQFALGGSSALIGTRCMHAPMHASCTQHTHAECGEPSAWTDTKYMRATTRTSCAGWIFTMTTTYSHLSDLAEIRKNGETDWWITLRWVSFYSPKIYHVWKPLILTEWQYRYESMNKGKVYS